MHRRHQPDAVEIELIRSLYEAFLPSVIMTVGFVVAGGLIAWQTGDPLLLVLWIAGCLASAVRLAAAALSRGPIERKDVTIAQARKHEWWFALSYFAFAAVLGAFGLRTMLLAAPELHMLMICLLVGYCAGVAAGIGLRPLIAIPSLLAAMIPAIGATASWGTPAYLCTAALSGALLAGGIHSLRCRYRRALNNTRLRLTFAVLAREDGLTELPNRLALREWFDMHIAAARSPGRYAVHYMDLNGFKPVNDTHGHPVGDALLSAVARRLSGAIRETDIAARLGGDEFAIIQHQIADADQARLLAERLAETIARPFRIDEARIAITACVGYVVCENMTGDLEDLLSLADEALYSGKRAGRSVSGYDLSEWLARRAA